MQPRFLVRWKKRGPIRDWLVKFYIIWIFYPISLSHTFLEDRKLLPKWLDKLFLKYQFFSCTLAYDYELYHS